MPRDEYKQLATEADILHEEFQRLVRENDPKTEQRRADLAQDLMNRDERDGDGHALVVRNGRGPRHGVTVGAGTIAVSAPRVND